MTTESKLADADWLCALVHTCAMRGAQRWQIAEAAAAQAAEENRPPPTAAELDAAYAACVERWIEDAGADPMEAHAYHIALRKHLLSQTQQADDYPTAARIAQDLAKLQDQYADRRKAGAVRDQNADRAARLRQRKVALRSVR